MNWWAVAFAWTVVVAYMTLVYVLAMKTRDNSIVDIAYGIAFVLLSFSTGILFGQFNLLQCFLVLMILIWAVRLSGYIMIRKKGEDWRYKKWRKEWGKTFYWRSYLQVYLLQGTFVVVVGLPVVAIMTSNVNFSIISAVGILVWVVGLVFESVGDWQLYSFKKSGGKGVFTQGLWKYTRHPNYFGEALVWWGIYILAIPVGWWLVISPIVLTYFLLRVSGVTMLETKYEGDKEYQRYRKRTNAFIPWPPRN